MKEILQSRALQIYGALLAATHVLSAYFWMDRSLDLVVKAGEVSSALCWPWAPFCQTLRFSSEAQAAGYLEIYALLGVITAVLFVAGKVRWAYAGLLGLLGLKIFFTSLSYGLMGNYHYMSFIIHGAFLFAPYKKTLIPLCLGIFYWGAGVLKLNPEWLSGVALIHPTFLPGPLEHISLSYAVLLECIFVVGLFSSKAWIRHVVLIQFVLFHAFSWHIVGYFYPLTMLLLLGLFVLIPLCKEPWEAEWNPFILKQKSTLVLGGLLIFLQLIPYLWATDPAASGTPRLVSLNMLDARMECETLLIRHQNRANEVYDPFIKAPSTRTQCDPIVFLSQIPAICKDSSENMDFWLQSRRTTDQKMQTRLVIKDVCKKNPAELLWAEVL
ncbi:hypothetical protein EZJ49_07165 [Bdellovibrio bacteriovorus]|uniref:hypothetical protein n=1 Tax=Bdellovibrio bacteriovorus TaxID=959 RepID=UPI0021D28445|nr:hypothetical protein [Bdellovibrio bacteriovorus]UXR66026.1 hypothetical protein EZJ49_07165 [Bdellovibrio bacteriovorus]